MNIEFCTQKYTFNSINFPDINLTKNDTICLQDFAEFLNYGFLIYPEEQVSQIEINQIKCIYEIIGLQHSYDKIIGYVITVKLIEKE
jgi:hypothetical protein